MTTYQKQSSGYAKVSGLDLYYEIHGNGQPLIMLPGAYSTIDAMGELVRGLARTRRVIGKNRKKKL